jgi:hypothetical protein
VVQDRLQQQGLVNTVMNPQIVWKTGNCRACKGSKIPKMDFALRSYFRQAEWWLTITTSLTSPSLHHGMTSQKGMEKNITMNVIIWMLYTVRVYCNKVGAGVAQAVYCDILGLLGGVAYAKQ